MTDSKEIIDLQTRVTLMQRHIESQDAEMYKMSLRMDKLAESVRQQVEQIKALNERSGGGDMPADEKPPHY